MHVLIMMIVLMGIEPGDEKYISKTYNVAFSKEFQESIKQTLNNGGIIELDLGKLTFESNDDFSPLELHICDQGEKDEKKTPASYVVSINSRASGEVFVQDVTQQMKALLDKGKLDFDKFTVSLKVRSFTKENREKIKVSIEKIDFKIKSVIKTRTP